MNVEEVLNVLASHGIKGQIDEGKSDTLAKKFVLRVFMKNKDDCTFFMKSFGRLTNTKWNVRASASEPVRMELRMKYECQHGKLNKKKYQKGKERLSLSKKCTDCSATVDIKIKLMTAVTVRRDPYLQLSPPLCAVIKADLNHNHSTESADALRYLPLDDGMHEKFIDMFNNGMTPIEAMRAHENDLLTTEKNYQSLASGTTNPSESLVYRMHRQWKSENFGSISKPPLEMLRDKLAAYSEKGVLIHIRNEPPWVVLIVTSIMRRAQALPSAKEIIFIDSTASVDSTQVNLTHVLTVTKAGAIQIASLLHQDQTTAAYTAAFTLLREHYPGCFGGQSAPAIFMTDDSTAERTALANVFPTARRLLCHFHMAQAEWRWLMSSSSGVSKNDRVELMKLFRAVMYAKTSEEYSDAVDEVESLDDSSSKFIKRLQDNLERKEDWVALFRMDLITRRHNTNNFAEASIRIMKDIILNRTKAFNVVALVEFCSVVWERYCQARLLNFAHNRRAGPHILYEALCKRMKDIDHNDIVQVNETTWEVPSASKGDLTYTVSVDLGVCSCTSGKQGGFCKHQAWLHKNFSTSFPNTPTVTEAERYSLAQLALGDQCPPRAFFQDLATVPEPLSIELPQSTASRSNDALFPLIATSGEPLPGIDWEMTVVDDRGRAEEAIKKVFDLLISQPSEAVSKHMRRLTTAFNRASTSTQAMDVLIGAAAGAACRVRRGGVIRVQPTALARRRFGITRGSKRVGAGRPVNDPNIKRVQKRKRNLMANVLENRANAKSHGAGH